MFEIVEETGSTNADLLARLVSGEDLAEGHWLLARRQTGGRGRGGRHWSSEGRNLQASSAISIGPADPPAQFLSLAIGLAAYRFVCRAMLRAYESRVALKWPNDVMIDGAKVAGILLERHADTVVAGIGINLHSAPEIAGRKTTFISAWNSKYEASQEHALKYLAPVVAEELALWRAQPLSALLARWCEVAHPIGTALSVHDHNGDAVSGEFAGLDSDGGLMLRLPNGSTRVIHAGDVMLEN